MILIPLLLTNLAAYDFGPMAEHCDYITRHDVCVVNAAETEYPKILVEVVTSITLAEAGAPFDTLEGIVLMFVDSIGDPRILGVYMDGLNLIKVRPINACIGRTALAHEFTHAIEHRLKAPVHVDLDHDDPFYWAGYHFNAISEPWGVAIKSAIIASDLLCR